MPKHKIAITTDTLDSPETPDAHQALLNFLCSPEMAEKIDILYVGKLGIIDHSWIPRGEPWVDKVGPFTLSYFYEGKITDEVQEQRSSRHNDIINFVRSYKEFEHQYKFPLPEQVRLEMQKGVEAMQRMLQIPSTSMFGVRKTPVAPEFAIKLDDFERNREAALAHDIAVRALVMRAQRNEIVASAAASSSSPAARSEKPNEDAGFGFVFD